MGAISKWLMQDEQNDLFEILLAGILNVVFLAVIAWILWVVNKPGLAFGMAKGFGLLWIVIFVITALLRFIHRLFRVNIYDHANAYVVSNLVVSCLLQIGWSAFVAITVHRFVPGVSAWMMLLFFSMGLLSCLIAYFAVSSFFQGHIYKMVSLPLALVIFIVISVSLWS